MPCKIDYFGRFDCCNDQARVATVELLFNAGDATGLACSVTNQTKIPITNEPLNKTFVCTGDTSGRFFVRLRQTPEMAPNLIVAEVNIYHMNGEYFCNSDVRSIVLDVCHSNMKY